MSEEALEVQPLTRIESVVKNIDPTGKEWQIKNIRGSALLTVEPHPFRKDFQCPQEFAGRWTSKMRLQEQITLWLNRAWDAAEIAIEKSRRAAHAKKQAKSKSEVKRIEVQTAEK